MTSTASPPWPRGCSRARERVVENVWGVWLRMCGARLRVGRGWVAMGFVKRSCGGAGRKVARQTGPYAALARTPRPKRPAGRALPCVRTGLTHDLPGVRVRPRPAPPHCRPRRPRAGNPHTRGFTVHSPSLFPLTLAPRPFSPCLSPPHSCCHFFLASLSCVLQNSNRTDVMQTTSRREEPKTHLGGKGAATPLTHPVHVRIRKWRRLDTEMIGEPPAESYARKLANLRRNVRQKE